MKKTFPMTFLLLFSALLFAQGGAPAANTANTNQAGTKLSPGSLLPIELAKSIDAKKAHTGDPVVGKIPQDLSSNGKVVIPRDTKVIGHVTEAKASTHDDKNSALGITFDKIALKDGPEIPLKAEVQAVKAPESNAYMSESGPPPQNNPTGANQTSPMAGRAPVGPSDQPSAPGNNAANSADPPLTSSSQGVIGMKGYSLAQGNMQDSVISSQENNVKLESGTQILLKTK